MADMVVTAADVLKYSGARTETGTAGETITAGMAVYKLAADSEYYKADDTSAVKAACVGIALNNAGNGQPLTILKSGDIDPGATVVVGTVYGVTDTAGGIGDVAERLSGDYVTVIGIGITASKLQVAINQAAVAIP